jgi:hypothetical protein
MGWKPSGWCFDQVAGVLLLELNRAAVSESGVQPPCVIDFVDEPGMVVCDICEGFTRPSRPVTAIA